MKVEELQGYISEKYKFEIEALPFDLTYIVPASEIIPFCTFLRDDPKLRFDNLMCLTAVDEIERVDVVYHLHSYSERHRVELKVPLKGDSLTVESVTALWPGANWLEREIFDLFGIRFTGHPDLRRILLPEDWEGSPLRKDYPVEGYRDIPSIATRYTRGRP